MRSIVFILMFLSCSSAGLAASDGQQGKSPAIVFAGVEEGGKILGASDEFVRRLSPFDRAARMKTDQAVSEEVYLAFVTENVLPWTDSEKATVQQAVEVVREGLSGFSLNFPEPVFFVKTTGREEGGAAYTRDSAVILPKSQIHISRGRFQHLIAHELLHVLTRNDVALRESLYEAIGFKPCNEIAFPKALAPRKITNPDAPRNDHYLQVSWRGRQVCVVPILFAREDKYDVNRGGEFFNYLVFKLLVVHQGPSGPWVPVYEGEEPVLLEVGQVSRFYEQVGRNTGYIIHPEEIIADNFALIATGKRTVASPEVLERIEQVLAK